jgi:hypothetical protein
MAKRPIAGKITVDEGMTTIDLHVGAQTLKRTGPCPRVIGQGHEPTRQDMGRAQAASKSVDRSALLFGLGSPS